MLNMDQVRDHIPLEQGLRLVSSISPAHWIRVRDHIPLEQGLRPALRAALIESITCQRPYSIRTRIKTQNLRYHLQTEYHVRDHIPLEQGLRLNTLIFQQ